MTPEEIRHARTQRDLRMTAWPMTEEKSVDADHGHGDCAATGCDSKRVPGSAWCEACRHSMMVDGLPSPRARRRAEQARRGDGQDMQHIPYTGKPHRPDYYKPQRKNPRIDPSADASDVTHAWGIDDPRIASAIERLLRAGKKPGEPLLKDLHKTMEEIHRAIEYAEMEG